MLVGDKIKKLRKEKRMTQKELALKLGLAPTAVSAWERNANKPMMDSLSMMAELFNVPITHFYEKEAIENSESIIKESSVPYNYIPHPISAGLPAPVEASQQLPTLSISDSVMGKYAGHKDIHMMRVNGESMNKVIPHNSLIAVKRTPLCNIKDGDIVVYRDDYDYAVKRMYRTNGKLIFRPDSHNPMFTDYVTDADEQLDIIGKVVIYIVELD